MKKTGVENLVNRPDEESDATPEKVEGRKREQLMIHGLETVRALRGSVFRETDPAKQQAILDSAFIISAHLRDAILQEALEEKFNPATHPLREDVEKHKPLPYTKEQPVEARFVVPPQPVVQSLVAITKNFLTRIKERTGSLDAPSRPLNEKELYDVFYDFFGNNKLSKYKIENLFAPETLVYGVMTTGLINTLIFSKLAERFGSQNLHVSTRIIAVDKNGKRAIVQIKKGDAEATRSYVLDDIIHAEVTIRGALRTMPLITPKADIYGNGICLSFREREHDRLATIEGELAMKYQEFVDAVDLDDLDRARAIYDGAERYAQDNNVSLLPGFLKRRAALGR